MPSAIPTPSVSVCGVGAVTGYGWGAKYLWDGVVTGEPAARLTPGFGSHFPTDEVWISMVPEGGERADGTSKFSRAFTGSAREAIEDAQRRGWRPGAVVGMVHAVVLGDVELAQANYGRPLQRSTVKQFVNLMPSTPRTAVMAEHDFHGPVMGVTAMCASGNAALLTAKMWINAGLATDVIVVATDISGTPKSLRPFVELGVAVADTDPLDGCRPFQEGSRGFIGGEASVAMVVSGQPDGSYASLLGGAMTNDGHHAISIDPSHTEIRRCITDALDSAGVGPDEITYLNAHGPGTKQCDEAEAALFDEMLPHAHGLYSFKPMVGHCQGAAAALEVAIECLSMDHGEIPAPPKVAPGHPRLLDGPTHRLPGAGAQDEHRHGRQQLCRGPDQPRRRGRL